MKKVNIETMDFAEALPQARPGKDGEGVRSGQLNPLYVKTFLDCFSHFPIGSYVQLSDSTVARVIRSNGKEHTTPIVAALNSFDNESENEVNLKTSIIKITEAILDVELKQRVVARNAQKPNTVKQLERKNERQLAHISHQ